MSDASIDSDENYEIYADTSEYLEVSIKEKDFTVYLITMYKDCPELWDNKKKTSLSKRNMALEKITDALKIYDKEFTVDKLKRKINTLRSNFNREHNKVKMSVLYGTDDDVYIPKLWYYKDLLFITDGRDTENGEQAMRRTLDNEPTTSKETPNPKKQKVSQSDDPDIDIDIIAKSWAIKLKRMDTDQRRYAEKIINDVLFEGEMGSLTRNGINFLATNPKHFKTDS